MIKNNKNKRGMALSQIIIILLGTIAFSYILGSEIGFVSAEGEQFRYQYPPFTAFPLTYQYGSNANIIYQIKGCLGAENNDCPAITASNALKIEKISGSWIVTQGVAAEAIGGTMPPCFDLAASRVFDPSVLAAPTSQCYYDSAKTAVVYGTAPAAEEEDDTGGLIQDTACAQYSNGAVFSSSCSAGCFADALVVASDGACCVYGCAIESGDDNEGEPDDEGEGTPDITSLLSGAGNTIIENCMQAVSGDWSKIAGCVDAATRLADSTDGEESNSVLACITACGDNNPSCYAGCVAGAGNALTASQTSCIADCSPGDGICYAGCLAESAPQDDPDTTTDAPDVPDTSGNWQGKQIVKNILNIVGATVEAISFYILLKQLEKAIPGLADLDPTSSAAAWLNLAEAALAGATLGADLAINSLLFNTAIPSIFGLTGASAALAWSGIGIAAAIALFLIFYKQTTVKAVALTCIPWQAPLGGDNCRLCGANGLPCSEYQCKSLGQGCGLLPSGDNGEVLCEFLNEGDTIPPIMSFYNQLPVGYNANPAGASVISQGDTGVTITSSEPDGKIPPSTILTVGVTTDEPSRCGISLVRYPLTNEAGEDTFKQLMPMSAGFFRNEHAFVLNSPGIDEILTTSGKMDLYIRCGDGNGNNATAYFVIEFEVSEIPDTSPPIVVRTDLPDNSPVPFGIESLRLPIYIKERTGVAECRWSRNNRAYEEMEEIADCTGSGTGLILGGGNTGLYKCFAQISGIIDGQTNPYYFRCKDTLGNVHSGSDPFSLRLRGTQPLEIISANPNNTLIKDSTDSVKVTFNVRTAAGSEADGTATCEYNNTVGSNKYTPFDTSLSYINTRDVWLPTGNYLFPIRCVDPAGNADYSQVNFRVETDIEAPVIVRASHENANLNIKTNEESRCVYDVVDCNYEFDDGISMITSDGVTHATSWVSGRTYYIKCKDLFNRAPTINSCSVNGILSTSQF